MNFKKDSFISVGLVLNKTISSLKIKELHSLLENYCNYFEIILLNNRSLHEKYDHLLKELTNIRIIQVSNQLDIEYSHNAIVENCIGDYCCIIDLNHDGLNDLLQMLNKAESYDVVIGNRIKKIQSFSDSITSSLFYKIISLFTGIKINQMLSDFFVINRKVINFINKNKDKVKYLKLLKLKNGFSLYEYSYMPIGKKSFKRTFFENINFTIDILLHFSNRLIRMVTILSLFTAIINLFYIFYVILIFVFKNDVVQGWASSNLYNATIYFVLFLVLAVIGEYVRMLLQNQKNTPVYEITDEKSSVTLVSDRKNINR